MLTDYYHVPGNTAARVGQGKTHQMAAPTRLIDAWGVELRIDYGPGYRLYMRQMGNVLILLLAGGTKKTQEEDIAKARRLAKEAQYGA